MLTGTMRLPGAETMGIREENQGDALAIRSVHEQAFGGDVEPRLVDMLREADRLILSLVAVVAEQVVGHVVFSPVTLEPPPGDARWAALGPIGVLPDYQGQGIGSRLVREGLGGCGSRGCDGVVLLGAPEYYSRFGFVRASEHGLISEFGGGPEFQAVELQDDALGKVGGLILYPPEFKEASRGAPLG